MTGSAIPAAPFDLVIARLERCTFCDKCGVLVALQEQPAHDHIRIDYV